MGISGRVIVAIDVPNGMPSWGDLSRENFDSPGQALTYRTVRRLRAILDSPPIIYGTPEYREPRLSIPGKVERVWVNGAPFVKVPG